ncbi:MAG TPA: acyltransferase, partial [Ktedonobacteraceae bacterium]|nr:acyltransferase [Ktedonobacteraceae bacterium]
PAQMPVLVSSLALAGDSGVTLFFILSGFLLFMPYAKTLLFDAPWPSLRVFYLRRALRILPAYYVTLFAMILLYSPSYLQPDHLKQLFFFLTLFMDSSTHTFKAINGPFWSLAVEWQFYLLLPLLMLAIRPLVRRGSLVRRIFTLSGCLFALAAFGLGTRALGLYVTAHPTATFHLPPIVLKIFLFFTYGVTTSGLHGKFLEDFAIGMTASACYILASSFAGNARVQRLLRLASPLLLLAGLACLLLMAGWKYDVSRVHSIPAFDAWTQYPQWSELGFSIGYGLCLLAILFGPAALNAIFSWHPLRWLGILSFGIYMWHLKLLEALTKYVKPLFGSWAHLGIYGLYWGWFFAFVAPFALVLFMLVEKPSTRLSDRLRKMLQPRLAPKPVTREAATAEYQKT